MSTKRKTAKKTEKDKPKVAKSKALKATPLKPKPLKESANDSIQNFLDTLDGEPCRDLYAMVIAQVEEPLLTAVMSYTRGNQSKASEMLGLNRGTLRKKLREHKLLTK
jgi:Fis family transcriptional regulator